MVGLVSAAMLGGCTPDADDASIRLCKDAMGRRVAEANCQGSGGTARGFSHAYISNRQAVPAEGQAIGEHRSSPGNGEVRSPEGRVVRGGLGGSARGSVGS
ncbi:hypothetical protein CHU93_08315 [Sandarakinorhabdus cyanobacteriorum]|uniref:Uncharacterized protein n=2 Tax=Sandarakinorhabdus cyanobacteriorum TaxID=1981098 RepID=A0A255YI23_9SPHN|nr:hypothetical protein CHU93_08315 [Sandarakinorhabdus cyanobacteriorum]